MSVPAGAFSAGVLLAETNYRTQVRQQPPHLSIFTVTFTLIVLLQSTSPGDSMHCHASSTLMLDASSNSMPCEPGEAAVCACDHSTAVQSASLHYASTRSIRTGCAYAIILCVQAWACACGACIVPSCCASSHLCLFIGGGRHQALPWHSAGPLLCDNRQQSGSGPAVSAVAHCAGSHRRPHLCQGRHHRQCGAPLWLDQVTLLIHLLPSMLTPSAFPSYCTFCIPGHPGNVLGFSLN